jgi:hypothetical protein
VSAPAEAPPRVNFVPVEEKSSQADRPFQAR